MNYRETIDWLFGLEATGIKFGLDNTRELLRRLGNPHHSFKSIHVGGTDGKGSVCAMLHSTLMKSGLRTGLYTSPHLVDFSERIQVDGSRISEREVLALSELLKTHYDEMDADGKRLTFFELTTAMAFLHFENKGVEFAVVEVGMGGRLDATNLLRPLCTVITRIGMEHMDYLGRTIPEIAYEKAGIIKKDVPVVTAAQGEALEVIKSRADEVGAPVYSSENDLEYELISTSFEGTSARMADGTILFVPLAGGHQAGNMSLAYEALKRSEGVELDISTIKNGFAAARWPARIETISVAPRVILDVTHTASGAQVVASELQRLLPTKGILVLGVLGDKDIEGISREFGKISRVAIATAPRSKRAYPPHVVESALRKFCPEVIRVDGVGEAISRALTIADKEDTIIITGSLYTVGEAISWWKNETGE